LQNFTTVVFRKSIKEFSTHHYVQIPKEVVRNPNIDVQHQSQRFDSLSCPNTESRSSKILTSVFGVSKYKLFTAYTVIFFANIWLSGTRIADAGRSTPTYYKSIDAEWPKNVPFGVSAQTIIFGELFPKTPPFGRE
jgi:hypothetical protein